MSSSVRFSLSSRSGSPNRSMAVNPRDQVVRKQNVSNPLKTLPKKTCVCSPTTHPGSFWCSLHKNYSISQTYSLNRLNARRSAMTNLLVRIGTVEGDLVKRALAALFYCVQCRSVRCHRIPSYSPLILKELDCLVADSLCVRNDVGKTAGEDYRRKMKN
ncbi:hypothetical protein Hdeb2414_s0004g00141071 [Helianthus debilis subsp. tardiflorus]